MITIIVAFDKGYVIGNQGAIPWYISEDLKHFKEITLNSAIIMGRKTWESLKRKPLPNRLNIILTKNPKTTEYHSTYFTSDIEDAVEVAQQYGDVYVIGGSEIYKLFLDKNYVTRMLVSRVHGFYEGDTKFPEIDPTDWSHKLLKSFKDFDLIEYSKRN